MRCAAISLAVCALAGGQVREASAAHSPVKASVLAFWTRDAVCETGHDPPYWDYGKPGTGHGGSRYEGGIGFAPSTYRWWAREVGVLGRYPHAYLAPAAVQAEVAQWGLDHVGRWGCVYRIAP